MTRLSTNISVYKKKESRTVKLYGAKRPRRPSCLKENQCLQSYLPLHFVKEKFPDVSLGSPARTMLPKQLVRRTFVLDRLLNPLNAKMSPGQRKKQKRKRNKRRTFTYTRRIQHQNKPSFEFLQNDNESNHFYMSHLFQRF